MRPGDERPKVREQKDPRIKRGRGSHPNEETIVDPVNIHVSISHQGMLAISRRKGFALKQAKPLRLNNTKTSGKPWLARAFALFSTHYKNCAKGKDAAYFAGNPPQRELTISPSNDILIDKSMVNRLIR